jgi:hypothetical protein
MSCDCGLRQPVLFAGVCHLLATIMLPPWLWKTHLGFGMVEKNEKLDLKRAE